MLVFLSPNVAVDPKLVQTLRPDSHHAYTTVKLENGDEFRVKASAADLGKIINDGLDLGSEIA